MSVILLQPPSDFLSPSFLSYKSRVLNHTGYIKQDHCLSDMLINSVGFFLEEA